MFSRWGAFVYRFRRPVALFAVIIAIASGVLATQTSSALSAGGWLDADSESAEVSARLDTEFGAGKSSIIALFRSATPGADATSAEFQGAIATATAGLASTPHVSGIIGYAETGDTRFISTAGDAAYIVIELDVTDEESVDVVDDDPRRRSSPPAGYSYQLTGYGPITKDSAEQSEKDLQKAELVSLPIVALVLVLVFASIVAAGMPLLVAGLAIPSSLAIIYIVAQQVEMSIFVLNIATMLGLALAIDYSLFIVSRYREELRRGRTVAEAVERAVATAGKAVAFSGIAVAIGLSGLLLFEAPAIRSIGIAGAIVVVCSVVFALTFLPADAGDARASRQRAVDQRAAPPHPADRRRCRAGTERALGTRRARRHAAADRGADPDTRVPAPPRLPLPPPGAGRPGRRDLPARRREPRRIRRAADRVRARARRPRSPSSPTSRVRRPTSPTSRRSTPTRRASTGSRGSTGSKARSSSMTRRPARSCRPNRSRRCTRSRPTSVRRGSMRCSSATSAGPRSASMRSARSRPPGPNRPT